ncbi:PEP-CTERM sorting domain-containing protein [Aeoliella mucimassa]|uniref:PEP-CTERM motif protein n=1 Tax=Aeoliella mucimassa TaxID=2527972 RepID=A0A518AQ68_9BACT|nr:PEP-CTERM sorting domain-containing protein [Aeoliella mucimassa]QDU56864.1 PEP-CTERM motif protein [Aeoliella mucimassa]
MTRIIWTIALGVSLLACSSSNAQTTANWTGFGDGISFTDPANWNPTPGGQIEVPPSSGTMIINPDGLVNSFVVNSPFADVLLQTDYDYDGDTALDAMTFVTLDSLTAGGPLSITVTQGSVKFARFDPFLGEFEDGGGLRGDGDATYTESLLINGGYFESMFVSIDLNVQLDSGTLRLTGVGNPIASGASINFSSDSTATFESFESPADFVTEHLAKITVDGVTAAIGGNIEIVGQDLDFDTEADEETVVSILQGVTPAGPGDFNRNGSVDYQDWLVLNANLYSSLAAISAADRFDAGDTNNDGRVDELDFVAFKTIVETQTGASFATFLSVAVPEPSSLALLGMLTMVGLVAGIRKHIAVNGRNRSMSRFAGVFAAVLCISMAQQAQAVVVVEEMFDYADGVVAGLDGGTGFSEPWGVIVGDTADPTGYFEVISNQAIYNGNSGGQIVNYQQRGLTSAVTVDTGNIVTIDLDVIIGPNDTQIGRGIAMNFVNGEDVAFSIGKALNERLGLLDLGVEAASSNIGDSNFGSGTAGTFSLTATLQYDGADTSVALSNGTDTILHTFVGEQITFDAVRLNGYHQSTTGNGIDNLVIDVTQIAESVINLQIDPDGNATLVNPTGSPITIDLYNIASPDGNLDVNFAGIQGNDQSADGFPAGPGTGPSAGTGWEKAQGTDVGANLIGESYAFGSSTLEDDGTTIELGDILTTVDESEDLTFTYHDATLNQFVTGYIEFVAAPTDLIGDYNGDGTVNLADYTVWRDNLGASESVLANPGNDNGIVDTGDYTAWKQNFGMSAASLAAVGTGSAVPEPSTLALLGIGLLLLRRSSR